MKKCLIISGGDFSSRPENLIYDYVIACDAGILHAKNLNIMPDLIIGDFDSLKEPIPDEFSHIPVGTYPIRKDDSDTMIAARIALEKCFDEVTILCALGGRLDHTFSNLQTLGFLAQNGCHGKILSDDTEILTHTGGSLTLPRKEGFSLSLFALTDLCKDICISGSAYDVEHVDVTNTFPVGLSNYWINDEVTLSMESGILLIILSKYPR